MNYAIAEEVPGVEEGTAKRRYDQPVLTDLGSLAELTLGFGNDFPDSQASYGGSTS